MSNIGEKIKVARLSCGYTQSKLAELMNISTSTVARWEHNKTQPSSDDLIKLSKLLDIDFVSDNKDDSNESRIIINNMQLEDIRLEMVSAKEVKKQMTRMVIAAVLITFGIMLGAFLVFFFWLQKIDPNSEDQPVRVVEYYYAEEERNLNY